MQLSEQEMREAIGSELADVLYRQKTIVRCNEALNLLEDDKVKDEFKNMAEEDEKNLRMIETVVSNFGIRVDPKPGSVKLADTIDEIISDPMSLPLEKLGSYTLIKQNQMMCSHLIHKSVQLAMADVKTAIAPFEGVYATFSRHSSMLTSFMERSGVEWLTGKEPVSGLVGRARDAVGAVAGAILSKTAKPADEMSVLNVLRLDHRKVDVLFNEIESAPDEQQAADLFHQLKADLTSHSIAEEETVYNQFQAFPDMKELMADAKHEHEDIRTLLDDATDVLNDQETFLDKIDELKTLVKHHVDQEENDVFSLIEKHSSDAERVQLSQVFLQAKQRIQENVGVDDIIASAANEDTDLDSSRPTMTP